MKGTYVAKRFGFRITRGWLALILIAGALAIAAFWIGPFSPMPAQLQLLALSGDGRFREYVGIPSAWADTLPAASEATARFPIILAVHNAGSLSARPTHLAISLPSRYRITDRKGNPLRFHRVMGNPLVRYDLPVRSPTIDPGHQPTVLPGIDTLWLEPVVPNMYCTALSDSIPEFVSAPDQDPRLLSRVNIFYSFTGPRIRQRQAGLLTVQVDPNLVKRDPAPTPPIFETQIIHPEAPRPEMGPIKLKGTRVSWCGDPGQPLEIYDALYENQEGSRLFVLYQGGKPRKYLFDLNRDSIVELEMWDADNDGKFESRRPARMAIPSFLMPYREAVADTSTTDSLGVDTAAFKIDTVQTTPEWLRTFYDTTAGPLRFSAPVPSVKPNAAPVTTTTETAPVAPAQPPVVTAPPSVQVDTPKLRLFYNTDAGPFRFYEAEHPKPKPKPKGPKLLGVPVESLNVRRPR